MTGYVFMVHGGAVSWKTSLQKVLALSTIETGYIASIEAMKEDLWIKRFMEELSGKENQIALHFDNQSALFLMKNQMFHERTKHIDIKLHFVSGVIYSGKVKAVKVKLEENPADALIKPHSSTAFQHCLGLSASSNLAE